jgi:hypothetical protein
MESASDWIQPIQKLGSKFRESDLEDCEQQTGRFRLTKSSAFRNFNPNLEKQLYKIASKRRWRINLTASSAFRNWDPNTVNQLYKISSQLRRRLRLIG